MLAMKPVILGTLLLAACASPGQVRVRTLNDASFPPATLAVTTYTTFPDRPHTRIAELSTERGTGAVSRLKEKARALGADAIVIVHVDDAAAERLDRMQDALSSPLTTRNQRVPPQVNAVAIRYEH